MYMYDLVTDIVTVQINIKLKLNLTFICMNSWICGHDLVRSDVVWLIHRHCYNPNKYLIKIKFGFYLYEFMNLCAWFGKIWCFQN